ncbi:hypothetical protein [Singulisphaera sp. PoT]|uniref:hypothetical protein n=1 Tax=Singulisphaera sp. PoT TaxID=3411797 RepID=UPI003BF4C8B1
MPDRKSLVFTLWLTSLVALLASILLAPVPTSAFITVTSQPDCPHRHCSLCPGPSTSSFSAAMATDVVRQVTALPFEIEEQDRTDILDEPRVAFLVLSFFRKDLDRKVIAPRSILSLYPLRC